MDFANEYLWVLFDWNGEPVYGTQTLISMWVIMFVLIVFAIIIRIQLRRFKYVPRGFQNVVETLVEMMNRFASNTMGPKLEGLGAYFFSIFAFILLSNYSGLVGLRPPTADLSTTAALALSTFVMIHFYGIRLRKKAYFQSYFSPHPVFFPINLISEFSKPISLAFRLFGNILGGVIIMGLVYQMLPLALRFILPDILHIYFDVFVGALQAFIFTVLSMTFIQQASADL